MNSLQIFDGSRAAFGPWCDVIDMELGTEFATAKRTLPPLAIKEVMAQIRIGESAHQKRKF
jgi:hypothetical protein